MKFFNKTLALAFFVLLACLPIAHAQVTTSTLKGRIVDENGAPIVAATVVAVHNPSGAQYGITTNEDGRFTLPNLRVGGPYTITASFIGYTEQTEDGIYLSLGQTANLGFTLISGVELEEIVVIAVDDPNINKDRTGAATFVGDTELRRLPTISRSASDYTRLNPASDGNSFGGRNDQFNNFSLDGSIFNNPFGLDAATPGGQTDAQPISLDAIDQIQVNLAPYDVTQAGFTGAAVNAVTKSGTNKFSGTVFGFYRNQDMTGSKVEGEDIFVPDLNQVQAGFSIGGPIIKNKLFFFANAEIERREDLGSNFLARRPGLTGEQVSRVDAADLDAISTALFDRYGYETGPYENFLFAQENLKGIVKLDWNIGQNQTLTATYNFLDASKEKPAHPLALGRRGPDATTLQFRNAGYQINNVIHSGIVEHRVMFGDKVSNKLQVGYTAFRDSRDPFSTPFPSIIIQESGTNYIVAGHEPFSINNNLDQDVYQVTNNLNIFLKKHTLTIGASLERFEFDNSFNLGAYAGAFGGIPGAGSVQTFLDSLNAGVLDPLVSGADETFKTLSGSGEGYQDTGWALAETNVGQFAVYLQDEIDLTDRFKLTVGLRMDMPLYFDTPTKIQENIDRNCCYDPSIVYHDEDGNEITFDHTVLPEETPLISPRVGFNYDIKGDQTTILRGGSGLFTGRFPFVWVGNQVANPNFWFYTVTHPDFKFPQVWRSNLGLDQVLGKGWNFSADLIYTEDINGMMVRNYGLKPPTGNLEGVDLRPVYTAADRGNNAYVFTNTDIGYSFNATFQIRRQWDNGWFASLGYNFLDAKDASSIEAEISSDAYERNPASGHVNKARLTPSLYGNRHRFVGSAHRKFEYGGNWATTIAAFFQYAQGGRFTYTYSGDINNDGSGLNDLIYIPTSGELSQMLFEGDAEAQRAQRVALNNFIEQDDYLSANRGSYAEKYDILSPWYSNWDVRLLQDYILPNANIIQLSVDVLNIGNLINSDWGVRQLPTNTQPIGVAVLEDGTPVYSFDTSLTDTFTNDFSLLSRWQLQLGLRYIF
ncbi:MAG: TonB-dependent receptor [Chitinophagales bacterium]|nr:TonB-dependent receptor [Chitinophagales bacterium]